LSTAGTTVFRPGANLQNSDETIVVGLPPRNLLAFVPVASEVPVDSIDVRTDVCRSHGNKLAVDLFRRHVAAECVALRPLGRRIGRDGVASGTRTPQT